MKRILVVSSICSFLTLFQSLAAAQEKTRVPTASQKSWICMRKDGLDALRIGNYKEATNQLKGALLVALNGAPGNEQEIESRKDLTELFSKLKKDSQITIYSKLSRTALKAKLKKEFDPDVWYAIDGVARNNVIPKDKQIIGWAKMLPDKSISLDMQSWEKGAEFHSSMLCKPDQPSYQETLDRVNGLKPGEMKPLYRPIKKN